MASGEHKILSTYSYWTDGFFDQIDIWIQQIGICIARQFIQTLECVFDGLAHAGFRTFDNGISDMDHRVRICWRMQDRIFFRRQVLGRGIATGVG